VLLLATSTAACDGEGSHRGRGPRADEIPSFELVAGGKVVVGLQLSPVREERTVSAFRITKNPITVGRYKQCVSAEACTEPALASAECRSPGDPKHLNGPTFGAPDGDELPVTCVKPEQAIAYCRWLGGRLPDSTQWLAAARGPAVRRFAWGNELDACEQHRRRASADDGATSARATACGSALTPPEGRRAASRTSCSRPPSSSQPPMTRSSRSAEPGRARASFVG
jgi:formylglycine-generating enzyme required for sulfatase activity